MRCSKTLYVCSIAFAFAMGVIITAAMSEPLEADVAEYCGDGDGIPDDT
jgi:hypothetical protein